MSQQYEYECAMSGVTEVGEDHDDSDGLEDLPVGWTRVHITRRQHNPKWVLIQQVKNAMVEGLLSQFPPEIQEMQRYPIVLQIEAQFHALEQSTPKYQPDVDDVVFLSGAGEVVESLNDMREQLGLAPMLVASGDDEDDDGEDDEVEEAEEEETPETAVPALADPEGEEAAPPA